MLAALLSNSQLIMPWVFKKVVSFHGGVSSVKLKDLCLLLEEIVVSVPTCFILEKSMYLLEERVILLLFVEICKTPYGFYLLFSLYTASYYLSCQIFQSDGLMRILNVAAFAVSGYSSTEGRSCKPFNPLLGETYEADYPDKGLRFFSEKVYTWLFQVILLGLKRIADSSTSFISETKLSISSCCWFIRHGFSLRHFISGCCFFIYPACPFLSPTKVLGSTINISGNRLTWWVLIRVKLYYTTKSICLS